MAPPNINWRGLSGREYGFHVFAIPANFNPNQLGNYIYTKVVNNFWVPIYIGQGDLGAREQAHLTNSCILRMQPTHIHAHIQTDDAARKAEEQDLLALHTNSYAPSGCNEKIGG